MILHGWREALRQFHRECGKIDARKESPRFAAFDFSDAQDGSKQRRVLRRPAR